MTNPLPLLAGVAGRVLAGAAASEVVGRVLSPKTKEHPDRERVTYDNLDKPNKGERYVSMALK